MHKRFQFILNSVPTILTAWSEGPYRIEPFNEAENLYYVCGKDDMNTISMPMSTIRSVFSKSDAESIVTFLNSN